VLFTYPSARGCIKVGLAVGSGVLVIVGTWVEVTAAIGPALKVFVIIGVIVDSDGISGYKR